MPEAIRRCTAIRDQVQSSPVALAVTLHPLGSLHAMTRDFEMARRLIREGNEILGELGRMQSAVSHHEALVEMLGGRPAAAERRLRLGYDVIWRGVRAKLLARAGRFDAAAALAREALALYKRKGNLVSAERARSGPRASAGRRFHGGGRCSCRSSRRRAGSRPTAG